MQIIIGPCRIADEHGTYEPGETLSHPSQALIALASAATADPATSLPYAAFVRPSAPAPAADAAPDMKENG